MRLLGLLFHPFSPKLCEEAVGDEVVEVGGELDINTFVGGAAESGELADDVVTLGLGGRFVRAIDGGG